VTDPTPTDRLIEDGLAHALARAARPPRRWLWYSAGVLTGTAACGLLWAITS